PVDTSAVNNGVSTSISVSTTTNSGSDLILSMGARINNLFSTYGTGQTQIANQDDHLGVGYIAATLGSASTSPGTITTSGGAGDSVDTDWSELAIKAANPTPSLLTPTIMDTLPLTMQQVANSSSGSFTYTVPSGGTNKLEVVLMCKNAYNDPVPTAT